MKRFRSLFSIIIVLLLSVLCLSSNAFATDTTVTDSTSLANALAAARDGDVITLGSDITSANIISVPATANKVTLELGQNTLKFTGGTYYLSVKNGANLVINADEEGGITSAAAPAILPSAGSTVEVNGGNYISETKYAGIQNSGNLTFNSGMISGVTGITSSNGKVIINGGTIKASTGNGISATGPVSVEINGSPVISSESGVGMQIAPSKNSNEIGADVIVKGGSITGIHGVTVFANCSLQLENGTITGTSGYGITTNGTTENVLNSNYGNNAKIDIFGGTVRGVTALYLPAYDGETTISGGEIIGSVTGVEIRAGSLSVSGDTTVIKSTSDSFSYKESGSGTTVFGVAIGISQHTTKDDISVEINGGNLSGVKSIAAVSLMDPDSHLAEGFNLEITDGTFEGDVYIPEKVSVKNGEDEDLPVKNFISGGTFTPPVGVGDESRTNFLDESIVAAVFSADEEEGTSKANGTAQYFTKMEEAVAATQGDEGTSKQLVPVEDINDTTGLPDNSEENSSTTIIIDLDGGILPAELEGKAELLEGTGYYYYVVPNTGEAVSLGTPTKDGYEFAGWTVNGAKLTGTELVIDSTTNETKTVQATWTKPKPEPQKPAGGTTGSTGSLPGGVIPDNPGTPDTPDTPDVPDTPDTEKPSDNGFNWNRPGATDEGTSGEDKEAVTLYRVYNSESGEHLFTSDKSEVQNLIARGWNDEGTAWNSPMSGTPVYRLYSPVTGEHLYTLDENEINVLTTGGTWNLDNNGDPVFYSGGNTPIYRCYHEGLQMHHLTTDLNECHVITENGWNNEGIAFYAN